MGAGTVRSVHYAVTFDGNISALEEWNKELVESKKFGDNAAGSINKMEQDMLAYAQKIGLSKKELDELQKSQAKNAQIAEFSKRYGFDSSSLRKMSDEADATSGKLGKVKAALMAIAAAALLAGTINFFGGMVKQAADFETTAMSFEIMLHSADKAKAVLKDLNQFSIVTPFEPREVNESAKALLQFNVAQKDLMPLMKKIGDVASGSGKSYEDLARMIGKAHALDKIDNEMLQQMPVLYGALGKSMGMTERQVFEMASSGENKFCITG